MAIVGLKQSVADGLPTIFARWEGPRLPFMYLDVKGIVTCATGNALFSEAAADALSWAHPDGTPCSKAEVDAAYELVKAAWPGVQSTACARLTAIRLTPSAITSLIDRTIAQDWGYLVAEFPGCADWPADAQLMVLSSAWAWGSGFPGVWDRSDPVTARGTKFKSLLSVPPEFVFAAQVVLDASAHEETINPGIIPRDRAEVVMLQNAGAVAAAGADPSVLWYPNTFQAASA